MGLCRDGRAMMDVLTPVFRGQWESFGTAVRCAPPPPHAIRLATLLATPALLADALRTHARHCGSDDLRPVASAWSRRYLEALVPPVAVAATLLRHRFELQPELVWLTLDTDGAPHRFHLSDQGHAHPQIDTGPRYEALLHQHLAPLFQALSQLGAVPPKILWGNAARAIGNVLAYLPPLEPDLGLPGLAQRDRHMLIDSPLQADGRRNPLYSKPCGTLYRQCCLLYLMPPEEYCEGCPLDPQYRGQRVSRAPSTTG